MDMKILIFSCFCLILIHPINAKGNTIVSKDFSLAFPDTLPTSPAFLRCGDGNKGYGLYWIDKSNDEVEFKIYRAVNSAMNFTFYTQVVSKTKANTGTEYFYKVEDTPENFYTYKVTAADKSRESDPSNLAFIPRRPAGLSGKADSISVTLDWTYPDDHWVQFIFIERSKKPDSGFNIMAPIVSQNGVKFIDYSPEKGVGYFYRIRGAFYQPNFGVTCYTIPTEAVGPFSIPGIGRDYDGEINYQERNYKFKTFGSQTWMVDNLAYLPEVNPASSVSVAERRYYVYGYQGSSVPEAKKSANYKTYGVLYNWPAASEGITINSTDPIGVQGICPDGWHLPSNMEWMELSAILNRIRAARDSSIRVDAFKKGVKGVQTHQFEGDFAMPDFKEFIPLAGGYLQGDSNKFAAIGDVENYWSSTSRMLTDKGFHAEESGKGSGFYVRCLKGAAYPVVSTGDITAINGTGAASGGNVTQDGGAPVTSRGVCWNTLETPTTSGNKTADVTGTGAFSSSITGLTPGTIYYVRAYAINARGTAYGEQKQFTTSGNGALPSVTTGDISEITGTSAAVAGSLTAYGGAPVTVRGVCINTTGKPVASDKISLGQSAEPVFTGYLAELNPLTTYYVRAFATNSFGTAYGAEKRFTTGERGSEGTFEYFGGKYAYKTIGTQTWMTENLAYLPSVSPATEGTNDQPYYYVYGYEGTSIDEAKLSGYFKVYGVLYNWMAAQTACPPGWHLPDDKELNTLTSYLTNYGYGFEGSGNDIAKSMAATSGWDSLNIPGSIGYDQSLNNRSGFNALPAGQRTAPRNGMTSNHRKAGTFWSTTLFGQEKGFAHALIVFYSHDIVHPYPNADKRNGYSVRCLKND